MKNEMRSVSRVFAMMCLMGLLAICIAVLESREVWADEDLVIDNVTLVDVINKKLVDHQRIVIDHGKITYVGRPQTASVFSKTTIDGSDLIALPGFVNTHTHLWQHVAKGFYPSGNLQQWVRIYKYAHYLTEKELYDITLAAVNQALLAGITTVSDFASVNFSDFSLDATCRALNTAGMGGVVVWWNPASFLPADVKAVEIKRLDDRWEKIDIWMGQGPLSFYPLPAVYDGIRMANTLGIGITEHTMENVQEQRALFKSLTRYMDAYGAKLDEGDRTRLNEIRKAGPPSNVDGVMWIRRLARQLLNYDEQENKLTDEEKEMLSQWTRSESISQVPILEHLGALSSPAGHKYVSIHSVWLTEKDMEIYKKHNAMVSHNPESNMYLSSGIAPILHYKEKNICVSLATDGAASNDGINFFSAMRGLWNLQKIGTLDTSVSKEIDAWYVLQAATIHGAIALGKDRSIGSIEVGKEADIVLLSKEHLGISPAVNDEIVKNIAPLIIYSGNLRNVNAVISNGEMIVKEGRLTRFSSANLAERLTTAAVKVIDREKEGKNWSETFRLTEDSMAPYWFRYRSVRKKDTIDIMVKNGGSKRMRLKVAMSGQTFGGTASPILSSEAQKRFPMAQPQKWWDKEIILEPNENVHVRKAPNSIAYTISLPGKSLQITRVGANSEQILFLARS